MSKDLKLAINQVCAERQLAKEVVLGAIEAALVTAYKRNFGPASNIVAKIDPESGAARIYAEKVVSEVVKDPKTQISLAEARRINPNAKLGEVIMIETTPKDFGRIAAQTAKQVILQRIREAERDTLYSVYAEREGEIVNGIVQSMDSQVVILNLGKAEGTLPRSEQIPGERYRLNQRLRAYVMEVKKDTRGPRIVLSRNHRNMLRRLLELEVPEIYNGTVEIKAIAREPGSRSKVAVAALRPGVDPVGSCVGMRGSRIQGIVNELNGEKIDVVEWSPDVATFIANALSPAHVINVHLEDGPDGKTATVIVPDKELSLAIGKEGQNARLAAKLTGWRIDIKSASEAAAAVFAPEPREEQPVPETKEDLLARAEAILTGGSSSTAKAPEVSEVVEIELQPEPEVSLPSAQPPYEEALASAPAASEPLAPAEVGIAIETPAMEPALEAQWAETEAAEEAEEAHDELVIEGEEDEEWLYEYEEADEEDEDEEIGRSKKKKGKDWRKKHMMVYDEEAGRVLTKRRRKPSRRRDWELDEY